MTCTRSSTSFSNSQYVCLPLVSMRLGNLFLFLLLLLILVLQTTTSLLTRRRPRSTRSFCFDYLCRLFDFYRSLFRRRTTLSWCSYETDASLRRSSTPPRNISSSPFLSSRKHFRGSKYCTFSKSPRVWHRTISSP